jgi:hypothetical protein
VNNPFHRWWGCEICFDPVLDEVFGVSNNKQQVELHDDSTNRDIDAEDTIWDRLATEVKNTITRMVEANKELRKDSRTNPGEDSEPESTEPERIISQAENDLGDDEGAAQEERKNTSEEELEKRARQELIDQGKDTFCVYEFKVSDAGKAAQLCGLDEKHYDVNAENDILLCSIKSDTEADTLADINRRICAGGVKLYTVTPKSTKSLEDVFISLTHDSQGGGQIA